MKKIILVLLLFLMLLSGCAGEKKEEEKKEEEPQEEALRVDDLATIHETEFGGVYLKMGIDEFNAAGFAYGDSVDVLFSNGYTIEPDRQGMGAHSSSVIERRKRQ